MATSVSVLSRFRSLRLGGLALADYGFYVLCATAIVLLATQAVIDPRTFFQTKQAFFAVLDPQTPDEFFTWSALSPPWTT